MLNTRYLWQDLGNVLLLDWRILKTHLHCWLHLMKLICKFCHLYYGFKLLKLGSMDLCQMLKVLASLMVELIILCWRSEVLQLSFPNPSWSSCWCLNHCFVFIFSLQIRRFPWLGYCVENSKFIWILEFLICVEKTSSCLSCRVSNFMCHLSHLTLGNYDGMRSASSYTDQSHLKCWSTSYFIIFY